MDVHAYITLSTIVADLDKADDWFAEVVLLLQGNTDCTLQGHSQNDETPIKITKDAPDG